jgi:hypothetical protein
MTAAFQLTIDSGQPEQLAAVLRNLANQLDTLNQLRPYDRDVVADPFTKQRVGSWAYAPVRRTT